jgi:hypothetical protein
MRRDESEAAKGKDMEKWGEMPKNVNNKLLLWGWWHSLSPHLDINISLMLAC